MVKTRETPVICIVGYSKGGKTTLAEKIVNFFKKKGLDIAYIKHHHGHFDIDHPGKDSYRLRKAGADEVLLVSSEELIYIKNTAEEVSLSRALKFISSKTDLIIVEGFKKAPYPKIEVYDPSRHSSPCCIDDPYLMALISPKKLPVETKQFHPNEWELIIEFIESQIDSSP